MRPVAYQCLLLYTFLIGILVELRTNRRRVATKLHFYTESRRLAPYALMSGEVFWSDGYY